MAKSFIYDSSGTYNATLDDGVVSGITNGSTYTGSGTNITNELYANDQNISNAVTAFDNLDCIQLDYSSDVTIDTVALYFSAASSNSVVIAPEGTTPATTIGTPLTTDSSLAINWNITSDLSATSRYYYIIASGGAVANLSEVILGKTLTFPHNPNLSGKESKVFGVDVVESYGGLEYANKRHDGKRVWEMSFSNLNATDKTNFETMRDAISTNFLKFVYYDDSTYHWVRALPGSFEFTEVAYQSYNMNAKIIEQLA